MLSGKEDSLLDLELDNRIHAVLLDPHYLELLPEIQFWQSNGM